MDKELIKNISVLDAKEGMEITATEIRERYQYGTELSLKDGIYQEILDSVKKILGKTKEIIEDYRKSIKIDNKHKIFIQKKQGK